MKLSTKKIAIRLRKIKNNNLPLNVIAKYRQYITKAEDSFPIHVERARERCDRKHDQ